MTEQKDLRGKSLEEIQEELRAEVAAGGPFRTVLLDVNSLHPKAITDLSQEQLQRYLEGYETLQNATPTDPVFIAPEPAEEKARKIWTDPLKARYGGASQLLLQIEDMEQRGFDKEQIRKEFGFQDYGQVELLIEMAHHILEEKRQAYARHQARRQTPAFEDTSQYTEDPDRFLKLAKQFVVGAHAVETAETGERELTVEDLYIVWFSKTLQNWKALVSTSISGDGLYFEVTHNGEKLETYVDTYRKTANNVFSHHDF